MVLRKNFIFLTTLILLVTLSLFVLFRSWLDFKNKIIEMVIHEQKIHATQSGDGVKFLLQQFSHELELLADSDDIIFNSVKTQILLRRFFNKHSRYLKGISIIDRQGFIISLYPYDKKALGANVSNQKHNRGMLLHDSSFVSDVFTAVQGFRAMVISVPVKHNSHVIKRITLLLDFTEIAESFFKNIMPARNGYAVVFSRNGTVIFHPEPEMKGRNINNLIPGYKHLAGVISSIVQGKEGHIKYDVLIDEQRYSRYAYYMPVKFNSTYWSIMVTVPEDDIDELLKEFRNSLVIIFILLVLTSGLFIAILMKNLVSIKKQKEELEQKNEEIKNAMNNIKELSGLLPICSSCHKVRNDSGYWERLEQYIEAHSNAEFTHSLCPGCAQKLYPDIFKDEKK